MAKEKEARRPFNLKKEVKLLPGYIILLLWVIFTIALLGWVFDYISKTMQKHGTVPESQDSSEIL